MAEPKKKETKTIKKVKPKTKVETTKKVNVSKKTSNKVVSSKKSTITSKNNTKVFNVLGKEVTSFDLEKAIFSTKPHQQAMFDTILSERATTRQGAHDSKTRAEVSGGGKKPWRQKGTGRARHGSTRSPIWVGGGVAHGPKKEKNFNLKVNKKVRNLAYKSAWVQQVENIVVLDKLEFESPSTKDFKILLKNLKIDNEKRILFIANKEHLNVWKSARNIANLLTTTQDYLLVEDIVLANKILITKEILSKIQERLVK